MVTQQSVRNRLACLVAEYMYMEESEIPENELFSNFGLESVTLAKIVAKLNKEYLVSIHARDFLKHQTLRDASEFVFREISNQAGHRGEAQ